MGSLMFAWFAEMGLITWRDFKNGRTVLGMPPPSDYMATFIVFGALTAIAQTENGRSFAAITGWSLVLASVLNVVNPTFVSPAGAQTTTTTSAPLAGQSLSGSTAATPTSTAPATAA